MHRCQMWDTSEAYDMLNADESIYNQAMQMPDPEALRTFFEQTYPGRPDRGQRGSGHI